MEFSIKMTGSDFEKFFELSSDLLTVATPDGDFVRVNSAFERTLGWTSDQVCSRPFSDFLHPDDVPATVRELDRVRAGAKCADFQNRYRCADGSFRHLLWAGFLDPDSGLLFGTARDVTELVETSERFRVAIESAPTAIVMVDPQGRIELVNAEAEQLFGFPAGSLLGRPLESVLPMKVRARGHAAGVAGSVMDAGPGATERVSARRSTGTAIPVEVRFNPVRFGGKSHSLYSIVDLHAPNNSAQRELTRKLEEANRKLSRLAITDELTDTLNRRAFDAELRKSLRLFSRLGQALSLIMLDIDHFKLYNDRYGHPAGDEALRAVARLLSQSARDTDVVARYGGEEFAIVLPNTDGSAAVQIAERLKARIDGHPWRRERLTVSMGAATIPPDDWSRQPREDPGLQLVREADQALYFSKNNGKDRVTHFTELGLPAAN